MQISVSDGITAAILFSAGSFTGGSYLCKASLVAMDWIRKQEKIFRILEWVTLVIVCGAGLFQFLCRLASFYEQECYSE